MSPAYQGFACRQAEARGVRSAGAKGLAWLHAREIRSSESALWITPTLLPVLEQLA